MLLTQVSISSNRRWNKEDPRNCNPVPPPRSLFQVSERKRTAGYSDLSMKTSWRGFGENTWVVGSTCTWLRSLFLRRVAHCVDSCLVSQTHLCAPTHTYTASLPTFWWRPLDGAQAHHHLHHAALLAPAAAAAHSACWELGPYHPGDKPQLSRHPLIWSAFYSPPGFVCVRVCVCMCTSVCMCLRAKQERFSVFVAVCGRQRDTSYKQLLVHLGCGW